MAECFKCFVFGFERVPPFKYGQLNFVGFSRRFALQGNGVDVDVRGLRYHLSQQPTLGLGEGTGFDDANRITHARNVIFVVSMANRPLSNELAIFWMPDFTSDFHDARFVHLVAGHFSDQFTLGHFSPSTLEIILDCRSSHFGLCFVFLDYFLPAVF
jgi:hypothetical protein